MKLYLEDVILVIKKIDQYQHFRFLHKFNMSVLLRMLCKEYDYQVLQLTSILQSYNMSTNK